VCCVLGRVGGGIVVVLCAVHCYYWFEAGVLFCSGLVRSCAPTLPDTEPTRRVAFKYYLPACGTTTLRWVVCTRPGRRAVTRAEGGCWPRTIHFPAAGARTTRWRRSFAFATRFVTDGAAVPALPTPGHTAACALLPSHAYSFLPYRTTTLYSGMDCTVGLRHLLPNALAVY